MNFGYRLKVIVQFFAFAFYPKVTLIVCSIFTALIVAVLLLVMHSVPEGSVLFDIVYALATGAVASFFVSVVVEMSNNYRHNRLAWYELKDYYSAVSNYESMKQVLMQKTPMQRAEKKAQTEFREAGGVVEVVEEEKDLIQATWELLPGIMPILKNTLENDKEFLSNKELDLLSSITSLYKHIRDEIKMRLREMSPLFYDMVNHPDEGVLSSLYPRNVIDDIPDWLKNGIVDIENKEALDRLADVILSDKHLLDYLLEDYDISENGLRNYNAQDEDDDDTSDSPCYDDDYLYESEDENEYRKRLEECDLKMKERQRPFVSWHISQCCSRIDEAICCLEKIIIKKPYYSLLLSYSRKAAKESLNDELCQMSYEYEKKRLNESLSE